MCIARGAPGIFRRVAGESSGPTGVRLRKMKPPRDGVRLPLEALPVLTMRLPEGESMGMILNIGGVNYSLQVVYLVVPEMGGRSSRS